MVPNSESDWIISLVYFSLPFSHCVSRRESIARSAAMWSSHPTQQDLLPSSGQLLSKVVPFLQMQHDTTGNLFHRVFINWWDFNPLKSNWRIQTQSLATVTEGYGLWNLIMRSSRTLMYRWYRGAASITRGVHCADPKLIHSDRTSESEFKWHVMVGPFRVTQCSTRCWGICENAQSISHRVQIFNLSKLTKGDKTRATRLCFVCSRK